MKTVKAILFDLDDTLFDCSNTLVDNARKKVAEAMVAAGLNADKDEVHKKMVELSREFPRSDLFARLAEHYKIKDKNIIEKGVVAYNSDDIEGIKLFEDVASALEELRKSYRLALVTDGAYNRQKRKIEILGLEDKFDLIIINDIDKGDTKDASFLEVMKRFDLGADEIVSVGDRIHTEIKIANELGMISVQIIAGRFKDLRPKYDLEKPDYKINKISGLFEILHKIKVSSLNVVAIGGGTGLPVVLEGIKKYTSSITAIVTMTDSGRSSGMLRRDMNVLPPGDIRNCLVALSESEKLLRDLFQYRFDNGNLKGHSFGNLFITAMAKITGSFEESVKATSKLLDLRGAVLPSTLQDAYICAELSDGNIVEEDVNIIKRGKPPIKRVFLKPSNVRTFPEVLNAIENADIIILGPGSLFTSVIPNLIVGGVSDAIRKSKAKKIYVCNIATQPGQTDNFKASDHIKAIEQYLGKGVINYIILNESVIDPSIIRAYEKDEAFIVENDIDEIKSMGIKPIILDLVENIKEKRDVWKKQDLLRHDSNKLAKIIIEHGNGL